MDQGVRLPTAAGTFYPHAPATLQRTVDALLAGAGAPEEAVDRPFAIVVPHAGLAYSGPVAASAYAVVRRTGDAIHRVALFGPAHFVPLAGSAMTGATTWRTPFGDLPVDEGLRDAALDAGAEVNEQPHRREHALEVQLPWLQRVVGAACTILPVAVGVGAAEEAARVIAAVGDAADLVVISTDLSHYYPIEEAHRRDARTAEAVRARDPDRIEGDDACGVFALRGIVALARERQMRVRQLDLRTSGDIAGHPERVVGYGAFAIGAR